tara:strand:+ start:759 stop:932 length:174 start_codon:yes stop_codon:yes gene_type:complete
MNQELVRYRVYDKKGQYHHSYISEEDAINCAKHVMGSVKIIETDSEKEVFIVSKRKK